MLWNIISIGRHTSLRTVDIRGSLISSDAQTDIVLVKSYSDCQIIITEAKKCEIDTSLKD